MMLGGCVQVPELGDRVSADLDDAPYPALIPLDKVLGPRADPQGEAEKVQNQIDSRRRALNAKARAIRSDVIDETAQDRLKDDVGE